MNNAKIKKCIRKGSVKEELKKGQQPNYVR
jgi:hypothetical protein